MYFSAYRKTLTSLIGMSWRKPLHNPPFLDCKGCTFGRGYKREFWFGCGYLIANNVRQSLDNNCDARGIPEVTFLPGVTGRSWICTIGMHGAGCILLSPRSIVLSVGIPVPSAVVSLDRSAYRSMIDRSFPYLALPDPRTSDCLEFHPRAWENVYRVTNIMAHYADQRYVLCKSGACNLCYSQL
jgi:hypothetical protein